MAHTIFLTDYLVHITSCIEEGIVMPTPIEILLDPISLIILAIYAALMLWEAILPGRKLPQIKGWWLRGLLAFTAFFYLSTYLPLIWDRYLEPYQVFDLKHLGIVVGSLIGVLIYEFGVYVWHRCMHASELLWRVFHQMHHSAERIDTFGAFYFSPMDMIGWTTLSSLCLTLFVGIHPEAITITVLATTFLAIFQHANIKTPRWLGYIIQRPESHTVHHGKGIHRYNYSDIPLFDILLGTFKNPSSFQPETGFYYGASACVKDMLLFKKIDAKTENTNNKLAGISTA